MAGSLINKDSIHFIGQASSFTVGANLVTNGDFSSAGGGGTEIFTGWNNILAETDGGGDDYEITDVDNGQFHGGTAGTTHACNIWSESGDFIFIRKSTGGLTVGKTYRLTFDLLVNAGSVKIQDGALGTTFASFTTDGAKILYFVATDTGFSFSRAGVGILNDITIDNIEVVEWVGDPDAAGGCTIDTFTGTLLDYMGATGGVLHEDTGLALSNDGGSLAIAADTTWDKTPIVGTFVNCDFSATFADGIYEITAASDSSITIDLSSGGLGAETVDVWIGGAYPDIATALNDSTLSEDPDGTYRKRYICTNVPMVVDAVTDFVAETSETALREDDGSRKIIGFYDSISVVQPDAGYRVVSDCDKGETYYAGARRAFNLDESFTEINPNGKWVDWDANGNDINIIEMNTSNLEFRNLKIHNTATGGAEGLIHTGTANFNITFTNCWFDTSSRWQVNDAKSSACSISDCFFGNGIGSMNLTDWQYSVFLKCIFSGDSRTANIQPGNELFFNSCLIYKGILGISATRIFLQNCVLFDQTSDCYRQTSSSSAMGLFANCIFSPLSVSGNAIDIDKGSMSLAGFNNIMYSVTAGAVLTNPIVHDQISPNPPLPVGTLEIDPLFVNPADGDFRLQSGSPARNAGIEDIFGGKSDIGIYGFSSGSPIGGGFNRGIA